MDLDDIDDLRYVRQSTRFTPTHHTCVMLYTNGTTYTIKYFHTWVGSHVLHWGEDITGLNREEAEVWLNYLTR